MRNNRSIPHASVIPVLAYPDVTEAAAWLCRAFGFRERLRIGSHRVQLVHGKGAIVVAEGCVPADGGDRVMVRVEDADHHCAVAVAAGARIVSPPTSFPYGERQYTAEDFAGRHWTFSQSIADVDPAEWGGELRSAD
jgi:uncharacterized glyoxalase superfamily protein PhnB